MNDTDKTLNASPTERTELEFRDIIAVPLRRWKWVVLTPAVFFLIGLLTVYLLRPEWEITATVEIGQVGQPRAGEDRLIEAPQVLAARVRADGYDVEALTAAGLKLPDDAGKLLKDTLNAQVVPGTNFVTLRARAYSPETGQSAVRAVTGFIIAEHKRTAADIIAMNRAALASVEGALQESRRIKGGVQGSAQQAAQTARPAGGDAVLSSMLLSQQNQEIYQLEQLRLALQSSLSPTRTFPTKRLGDAVVSLSPVFPHTVSILSMAVVGGLALGLLLAFVADQTAASRRRTL
ncbi:LPS O-antigen subunit length determinant protein (WzzB/FepE family) [Cupriavidus gilardii J11]|uniref:LPS O-antigen subunit length determinant protein (WzzB/FepE family) n=1 Tax=Cupriavidus gilardii J11 TaxID=936133 RepID=A0A562BNA1_9BURK|nr:Wzz/FepE/Etk N-terminal domain-containing protein [Cupriavidus gilardii]TWG86419.1 LPS O-antigen subunit length determinant protein (WzzB/FepE family) [Cupriavidus gilardii J11]